MFDSDASRCVVGFWLMVNGPCNVLRESVLTAVCFSDVSPGFRFRFGAWRVRLDSANLNLNV
jgi:hypothetical protein